MRYLLLLIIISVSWSAHAARPAHCGHLNQPPCTIFEFIPSCEGKLREINGRCLAPQAAARPPHCGRQNQRPCVITEFIPSCESGLREARGLCLAPQEATPQPAVPQPAARPAHCGRYQQRPCAVNEFIPACDSGLLEARGQCLTPQDAAPQSAARPQHCGHVNQRPCYTHEYIRPCEKDLYEANGQCLQTGYQPPQPSALIPPQAAQPCAGENQHCAFNGTADVYYGAQNNWTVQTHANGVFCSNTVFGDPIPGVLKSCLAVVTLPEFAAPLPVETYPAPADPGVLIPPPYAQPDTTTQAPPAVNNECLGWAPSNNHTTENTTGWNLNSLSFSNLGGGNLTGFFLQTGCKTWSELGANRETRFQFDEVSRDDWSVYLLDRSRNVNIQLDVHRKRVIYSEGNGPRSDLYVILPPSRVVVAQPDTATQAPAAVNNAPQRPRKFVHPPIGRVFLYEDCDFEGEPLKLGPGEYYAQQLQARGLQDNTLSSLRVPQGFSVFLFDADKGNGQPLDVRRSHKCLSLDNFNDVVSSIVIRSLRHVTLYPDCFRPVVSTSQDNEDEIKKSLLLQPGKYLSYQLEDMGFRNDDLSAIRIPPSLEVELFEDDGFQGRSLVLTQTNLCLEKNEFDNRVSSLIVAEAGTLSQKRADPTPVAPVADGQKTNQPAPAVAEIFGCKSNEQWRWTAGTVTVESDSRACSPGAATSSWTIQGVAANALRATGVTDDQAGLLTLTVDDAGQRLSLHINNIRSTAPNSSEFRYGIAPDSPLIGAGKWERLQR